ncbi:GyrI-like domain-containing protein [Gorillibacterium massiliense]|uniref:GyrI-like domain-containing protein n=1 Tax=Gorillibacterium massiliense TaxID=1280390 RepID=UPI0004AE1510|nr:GyrI-like domain-containing protein [Gorillibacterium massiliense]
MSTAKKFDSGHSPQSYSPKKKPEIIAIAEQMRKRITPEETLIKAVDDQTGIVYRNEMKVVGVRVAYTPDASVDMVKTVRRYIKDGTCDLLERLVTNCNPGSYVAVMTDVKTGIDFTYIIGVVVEDMESLPEALPPGTVTCICPAGHYGKRSRRVDDSAKSALSCFAETGFREASGYVYDKNAQPYHFFDRTGELVTAYEPVKIPENNEERYDSVGWEIVTLPEIKAIGCTGEGMDCMFKLFAVENEIDWEAAGALKLQQYVSFGYQTEEGTTSFMGRQVADFSNTPESLVAVTRPSRLYVRFYQMQVNSDNPSLFYEGAKDELFFNKHPEYEADYSDGFYDLFFSQYEQGGTVLFPIKRKGTRQE